MNTRLSFFSFILLAILTAAALPALAGGDQVQQRAVCPLEVVTYDWDFNTGPQGFTTPTCDGAPSGPVWEYGTDSNYPGMNLWGTNLNSEYSVVMGRALMSPSFLVDAQSNLVQVRLDYHIEYLFDGMNVKANDTIIYPMEGYPTEVISEDTSRDPRCVDGEPGFTGDRTGDFLMGDFCFDLSAFEGQEVALSFNFGSDLTVSDEGCFIASVKVGGNEGVAVQPTSWSGLKALYR